MSSAPRSLASPIHFPQPTAPEMPAWPSGGLWRQPDFLKLWGSQTVSQLGTQVSLLALPLAAVLVVDASAFEVALLSTAIMVPWLVFALPAGVWVDRVRRQPILVVTDLGRAVALASVPLAYATDTLTMAQLYVVAIVTGTLTVFFDVAYQSYLPSIVERRALVDGNSKLEFSRAAASVAGPGLGGALVGALTAPYAVLVDAVSFLGSALLLFRIRAPEVPPERTKGASARAELVEGLRYVFGDPRWRSMMGYVASVNFFFAVAESIFIVYAVRDLDLSAPLIGLIFTLSNLGGIAGAVLAGRAARRLGIGGTLVASGLLSGPPLLLVPLAPQASPIPFLVAGWLFVSLGVVLYNVTAISLIQALTPERMLGRMNASRRFVVWGTIPIGSFVSGVLATVIGLRPTIFVGAVGASFSFLFLALSPLRTIHEMPESPTEIAEPRSA
jgi:MFS family permease